MYYLDVIQSSGNPPKDLVDPNIYSDSSKIKNLLSVKPDPAQQNALMEIVSNKEIHTELTITFVINKHFSQDNLVSLLYYLGYLTIAGTELDEIILRTPNKVIESVYIDYFRSMLDQEDSIDSKQYTRAMKQMLFEQKNTLFVELMERIMASFSSRDFVKMNESHVKLASFLITSGFSYVYAKTEYPIGKNFIDLVLLPHNISTSTVLFEFRYCAHEAKYKKERLYRGSVEKKIHEAKEQLDIYKQAKEFQNIDVLGWILIFCNEVCVYNSAQENSTLN